uniref:Uncharacterized protein n=1 Tax=Panagrolaimus sp. JU765 TaxID=591449 RepID=A0AC34PXK1_9BILA
MIKFAAYLKKNAIFEYNNAFEERMKMEIRNEEVAVQNGASKVALERLNNILNNYVENKKKMEATFDAADGTEIVDSTQITQLMADLFALPLYGGKIKELYDKNTASNVKRNKKNHFVHFDLTVNPL